MGPTQPIGWPPECVGPSGVTPQISQQTLLKEMLDGSMKPNLAASYETNTDPANPSITFHLQKGVKFHDGSDFNAQAVKFNLENIKLSPYYAANTTNWKSIEVIDDYTVRVNLNTWQNVAVRVFGDTMSYMSSPTAYEKNGLDWVRYHIVGTGPFMHTEWQRDVVLSGVRNDNYWEKGKPYLDAFKYVFVSDELTSIALFRSGGGDAVGNSNPKILAELEAEGNQIVPQYLGPFSLFPDSANQDSPWSNVKVRMAVEYAIDKEGLAKTFGYGWKPAYQFSTSASKAYDPEIEAKARKYNVAKAKELMAEAGYPNGFKTQIIAGPLFLNKDVVLAIQAYLGKIGIQAEAIFPDMAKWGDISQNPWKNALLYTSINEWGNQNSTFNYFLGDPSSAVIYKSTWKPDNWKQLLDESKITPEPDPVKLKAMENIIWENELAIPLYYSANIMVFKPWVKDHGQGTRGQSNWFEPQNTWLDK